MFLYLELLGAAYILKGGCKNPQTILNFPQKDREREKYQDFTVCKAFDCNFP